MVNPYSMDFNPIQASILKNVYHHRVCNSEQLTYLANPKLIPNIKTTVDKLESLKEETRKANQRICIELTKLVKKGFLKYSVYDIKGRAIRFYSIAAKRLNEVLTYLGAEEDGNGWKGKFGVFGVDKFELPQPTRIFHKAMEVDFAVKLKSFEAIGPARTDIIGNLYCAKVFNINKASEGKAENVEQCRLRPDGEYKLFWNDKLKVWGFLEVDMVTERSEELNDKFRRYKDYLNYAYKERANVPMNILAYTTAEHKDGGLTKRFKKFLNAYINNISKYSPYLNLIVTNGKGLFNTIDSEVHGAWLQNHMINAIRPLMDRNFIYKGPSYDDTVHMLDDASKYLGWRPLFTVTENNPEKVLLYLYVKFDIFESRCFSRVIDFHNKFNILRKHTKLSQIKRENVIPVFYSKGKPLGIASEFIQNNLFKSVLRKCLYYSQGQNCWYNEKLKPLPKSDNPLRYGLFQE